MSQEVMELTQELLGKNSTLLDICLALHGSNTGLSDPMLKKDQEKFLYVLKRSLQTWHESPKFSEKFDNAVKNLIEVTILETLIRDAGI